MVLEGAVLRFSWFLLNLWFEKQFIDNYKHMKKTLSLFIPLLVGFSAWSQQTVKKEISVNGVTFNMVEVEGGRFNMGGTAEQYNTDDDEFPIHVVSLDDYMIGETEVTQRLWTAVMGNNPSSFTGEPDLPVEYVTWYDCHQFIDKLNELTGHTFRLPTEAEWEYAARGGKYTHYYQYSGSDDINEVAWYGDNSGNTTHVVASLKPNELGLYDMSGNVFEWVEDYYGPYDMMPIESPTGPESGEDRIRRGGSWNGSTKGPRVSFRINELPGWHSNAYGLRLAATEIVGPVTDVNTPIAPAAPKSDARYNLMGQPVRKSHTGIVIEDGQKHLVK